MAKSSELQNYWHDKTRKTLNQSQALIQQPFLPAVFQNLHSLNVFCVLQLVAVFDEAYAVSTASPSESLFNGYSSSTSPEPLLYFPHLDNKESIKGEIEVNEAILKASM